MPGPGTIILIGRALVYVQANADGLEPQAGSQRLPGGTCLRNPSGCGSRAPGGSMAVNLDGTTGEMTATVVQRLRHEGRAEGREQGLRRTARLDSSRDFRSGGSVPFPTSLPHASRRRTPRSLSGGLRPFLTHPPARRCLTPTRRTGHHAYGDRSRSRGTGVEAGHRPGGDDNPGGIPDDSQTAPGAETGARHVGDDVRTAGLGPNAATPGLSGRYWRCCRPLHSGHGLRRERHYVLPLAAFSFPQALNSGPETDIVGQMLRSAPHRAEERSGFEA